MGRGHSNGSSAHPAATRPAGTDRHVLRAHPSQIVTWAFRQLPSRSRAQAEQQAMREFEQSVTGAADGDWLDPPALAAWERQRQQLFDRPLRVLADAGQAHKAQRLTFEALRALDSPYADDVRTVAPGELCRWVRAADGPNSSDPTVLAAVIRRLAARRLIGPAALAAPA